MTLSNAYLTTAHAYADRARLFFLLDRVPGVRRRVETGLAARQEKG